MNSACVEVSFSLSILTHIQEKLTHTLSLTDSRAYLRSFSQYTHIHTHSHALTFDHAHTLSLALLPFFSSLARSLVPPQEQFISHIAMQKAAKQKIREVRLEKTRCNTTYMHVSIGDGFLYLCIYIYIYIYICVCDTYIHICICTYICIYMYAYIHIHTLYTYLCVCVCVCVCMCVCMYVCHML